jgi:branched-chain amino acid transport system substrate-binding protein
MRHNQRRWVALPVMAVTIGGLALAGCSSSSSSSASAPASSTSSSTAAGSASAAATSSGAAAPTGTPIKLLLTASRDNPGLALPEMFSAAQAAVDSINASGGVNGHPLQLIQCDNNLDPNKEVACLNEAVSENVSAIVGSSLVLTDSYPMLEKAKIPLIGEQGIVPGEFTSPISFPFGSEYGWFVGAAAMAKADGITSGSVATLANVSAAFSTKLLTEAMASNGIKVTGTVDIPLDQTDQSAAAGALTKGNPPAVFLDGTPSTSAPIIQAMKQLGYTGKIYCNTAVCSPATVKALGSSAEGMRLASTAAAVTDTSNPEVKKFLADMSKYSPSAELDENAEISWSAVELYAEVMAHQTDFSGANVIATFEKVTSPVQAGVMGDFVGSGTPPIASAPRLLNLGYFANTVTNGVITGVGGYEKLSGV